MANRILVAEDDFPVRSVIVELLKTEGHHVRDVDDGDACLATLQDEVFDLLVLDLNMPKIDGFGVIRHIRNAELHTGRHIPILCITGVYTGGIANRCYQLGGDAFVEKPFSRSALLGKIHELLELRGTREDLAPRDLPLFDYEGTLKKFNGLTQVVAELCELFSAESRERMETLLEAGQRGDLKGVSEQAHTLKSISGTIGAHRMSHYAGRLEEAAERPDDALVSSLISILRAEIEEVHKKIREIS